MATTSRSKATAKNPQNPETPPITTTRKASTKSLEGRGKLDYELGTDDKGTIYVRISRNSGGGFFSDEWVSFALIRSALESWPAGTPITSMALRTLFKGKSVNTPSFLLAVLVVEGVVRLIAGKRRQYELGDVSVLGKTGKPKAATHSRTKQGATPDKKRTSRSMTKPTKPPAKGK